MFEVMDDRGSWFNIDVGTGIHPDRPRLSLLVGTDHNRLLATLSLHTPHGRAGGGEGSGILEPFAVAGVSLDPPIGGR